MKSIRIDLFISAGRRAGFYKETILSLVKKNPEVKEIFTKVWILDDRSNWAERIEMMEFTKGFFGEIVSMVTFDDSRPFMWVDKFNSIGKLSEPDSYIFLLEDDWECLEQIDWYGIVQEMERDPEITQIAMCDPLWIQPEDIIRLNDNESKFWKNPWPEGFRHISAILEDGRYVHTEVRMRHYTNNPSILRSSVFKETKFKRDKGFEHIFADTQKSPKQLFLKRLAFKHLGFNESLI